MASSRFCKAAALTLAVGALASTASCTDNARYRAKHASFAEIDRHPSESTLRPFRSDEKLEEFLTGLAKKHQRLYEPNTQSTGLPDSAMAEAAPSQAPAEPPAPSDGESITNVQTAGVDEGGIVKAHGDELVVLRRGRLFTVRMSGDLAPISSVDAFGPGMDPSGTWYDEMLVSDNTVVVIGYSYSRGGTEIGLFDIDDDGRLAYRDTYHLRSNDYYSSRNYASRLIGDKLIFYTPLYMDVGDKNPLASLPALRKWRDGVTDGDWQRIASSSQIYPPLIESDYPALHTVTVCDLGKKEMDCDATGVFGPPGRTFYVSQSSVFVWMTEWTTQNGQSRPRSLVYRMPLDGSDPSVLRVAGAPIDQFSFLEDKDGFLNVLVVSDGGGDAMWAPENAAGRMAALRVKLTSFSDGETSAPLSAYKILPTPTGGYSFQNRFVGDYLVYGSGSSWGEPQPGADTVFAYRYADKSEPTKLRIGHGVDRIEALGKDALVVGTDGKDLHFSPVRLGDTPTVAKRYTRANASQGELRSHGFFYKPGENGEGVIGLPIREAGRPGYEHLFYESASLLFIQNDNLAFSELGTLAAKPENASDDNCKASCVDWYGNARPLFYKGRVFALLGYEIVEGEIRGGKIAEKQRMSFAPSHKRVAR